MKKFNKFFEKYRQKLIIVFSVILFCLGIGSLFITLEVNVSSNDECLWVPEKRGGDSTAIRFDVVKVGGVTWDAGIRNGDYLIAINDSLITHTHQAQLLLNTISAGDYAVYTVKRGEEIFKTNVYIKKLINFPILSLTLLGVIWFLIGFVVLSAKPDGKVQRLFYAVGAFLIMFLSLSYLSLPQVQASLFLSAIFDMMFTAGALFSPFFVLYFFFEFPTPFSFVKKEWVKKALYITPLVLFISLMAYRYAFVYSNPQSANAHYDLVINIQFTLLISSFVLGLVSLAVHYFKLKTSKERRPLFAILLAYTLGVVGMLFTGFIAPAITDTVFNSPEFYMPIIILAILPVAFAFSIFKYQLMDVSVVIKNTIVYGAATITVAAIYFLMIYVIGQTISSALGTEYQGIMAGIIFIVFAVVFQSTKDRFQDFLTSKFYPEQFAYQKVLIRFSGEVSGKVGLDNILDYTQSTLVDALMVKHFGIMLWNEEERSYTLVRSVGISNTELKIKGAALIKAVDQKKSVEKIPVIEMDEFDSVVAAESAMLKEEEIFTLLPMIIKSKVIGILLFGLKHSGAQFAGKDLELLNAAANQTAVAIENARLYESEAEKLELEKELDLARKIQENLLPKCIPDIGGLDICGEMIPAMQVGGDYFDLIPVSEDKLFVIVGDVSGKGLSAALYMAKLQTMIQLCSAKDKTPKDVLVEVNKRMFTAMESNSFVTMTLALFDMKENSVSFCRAGHMPILATTNGKIDSYKTQGLGVGLEKGIVFEKTLMEEKIYLKPGQLFAFFSDGITEAMDEKKELFGEENLAEILKNKTEKRSSELMDEIWQSIKTFRGKAEQNDDMTMVLVKVSEKI
jgi:phosphoserine phosphatase RsbU/P